MNLYTDGGSRGNPGPAAIGVVIKDDKGINVFEMAKYIGNGTNNEAEYTALEEGLSEAVKRNITELTCYLDSELVVKQLNGLYKVKNERIAVLYQRVKKLTENFNSLKFIHVPRSKNHEADALVNKALDARLMK